MLILMQNLDYQDGLKLPLYNYLDSPSTTDATTYKLYWKSQINQTSTFNYASGNSDVSYTYGSLTASTITLMEIAG